MSSDEDEIMLIQYRKTSSRTPMKILLEHELSKETESKYAPSNLVARLMGLDTLPKREINTISVAKEGQGSTMMGLEEPFPSRRQKTDMIGKAMPCEIEQYTNEFVSDPYYRQGMKNDEHDVAFVGCENTDARHFAVNEKADTSEESEGILENLKSNKDLFLKFLQQPNSLFAQHLHQMSTRRPGGTKHITVLKPSNIADTNTFPSKMTEKWVRKPAQISQANARNKSNTGGFAVPSWKTDDDSQPTRIVVLKPCFEKASHAGDENTSPSLSPRISHEKRCFMDRAQHEAQQSKDIAKEVTNIIRESLSSLHMDEPFLSSVLSSGYNGDESSPEKSENEYAAESDCEPESRTSRYSWDYIDNFASCSSSISRVPRARESSVCREAKKRLSRRWNAMGLNENSHSKRHARSHSSNTLGEMLALSEIKKSIRPLDNNRELMGSAATLNQNSMEDETALNSPRNLSRSNSVPFSADGNNQWVSNESSHRKFMKSPDERELQKNNSLKKLVATIFFTRNKKSDKEYSTGGTTAGGAAPLEMGLSVAKPVMAGNLMESQDQPSPISVLEPLYGDDDSKSADSSGILSLEHPVMKTSVYKTNSPVIGKSPPIESIARTICWNNSYADSSFVCPFNLSLVCLEPEEEQDWNYLVQALLTTIGLSNYIPYNACGDWWDAPQMSLDPLLRDKYANATNHFMHGAKLRRWRSNRKLIFDSVNQALKDIGQLDLEPNTENIIGHPDIGFPLLVDHVWATMSQWLSEKVRCTPTDDGDEMNQNLAVERVVRNEVVGKRWLDCAFMKFNAVGFDIQQKLLDELLEETVLQLAAR